MADLHPGLGLFSTLPQEVRNMIFEYYFERAELTWDSDDYRHYKIVTYRKCYSRDLLMVSREMNAQASPFEYHNLCVAITRRNALLPLSLAQRARHIRVAEAAIPLLWWPKKDAEVYPHVQSITYAPIETAPSLRMPYQWLKELMTDGCKEKCITGAFPNVRRLHHLPLIFDREAKIYPEYWCDNIRTLAMVPCRIWKLNDNDEVERVTMHVRFSVHPFRIESIEYDGYIYPVPELSTEEQRRRSSPLWPEVDWSPESSPRQSGWWQSDSIIRRFKPRGLPYPTVSIEPNGCIDAVEQLLSRQPRRFAVSDKDYFTATDTQPMRPFHLHINQEQQLRIFVVREARNASELLLGAFRRFRRATARYVSEKLSKR